MRGKVLTDSGATIQVVEILDDSNREQLAIVTFDPGGPFPRISWSGDAPVSLVGQYAELREAAQAALRERDAHFMRTVMNRLRRSVFSYAGGVLESTVTMPVLSPRGRRLSFSFTYKPLNHPGEDYEVIIRRRRSARRDPGREGMQ